MAAVDLHVRLAGRSDLARQVYRQLRQAILGGRLRRGDRLPSTRELAARLDVSRNTASLAYEWLAAEGLVSGHRGGGTVVLGERVTSAKAGGSAVIRTRAVWDGVATPVPRAPVPYDFGVGAPDAALFPYDAWRRHLARQVRAAALGGGYGDPAGHPRLRAALARYVGVARGVHADADDLLITSGAQAAFDLVARVLLEPGARVAVEDPGYPPPRLLFASYGARVSAVPVDGEGLDVGRLPPDARLVYVTPAHQFPLGMPMSHSRRVALLDWAERKGALLLEDDYDSEFRFGGRPLETLHALDRRGRVVYVGSLSKSLLPGLRMGYLVAPRSLRQALRAASHVSIGHPPLPAQGALATLIEDGLLARHVRKMRRRYAARHALVLATLSRDFGRWLVAVPSVAGLHVAARLRSGGLAAEGRVASRARRVGVGFDRLSGYFSSDPEAGVVLGYGAIPDSKIAEGLRRLRECFAADLQLGRS